MKKGIFAKFIGQSSRHFLYRAVCILIALTALSSLAVSGVYAKYVDAASVNGSAGIARMGIVTFELKEHKAKPIHDDLNNALETDMLYKLLKNEAPLGPGEKNEYNTVIPGVDIPKDPYINLEFANNEVSYELYVKVEKKNLSEGVNPDYLKYITYDVTDDWEKYDTKEDGTVIYRFQRTDVEKNIVNGVFRAGTPYEFKFDATKDTSIHILKGDKIKVSQYFNSEPDENDNSAKFSLTFTAYLQQIINIPPSTSEGTGGSTDSGD